MDRPILARSIIILLLAFSSKGLLRAQGLYYPPLNGNTWATVSADSLGWCPDAVDSLDAFLERSGTKAFIVLKSGKMAHERYFGSFTQDSLWYWASAAKTLSAVAVGYAQAEALLSLSDSSSRFLGSGWTSLSPGQEAQIRVRDQLCMSSGLDDAVPDPHCTLPTCLMYEAPAGSRWAYHNAPYTLLHQVVESASGQSVDAFLQPRLKTPIGMGGFFLTSGYNQLYISKARDMARFGLFALSKGFWNGQRVFPDSAYFAQMISPSQNLNLSYGYLWWLNGQSSHMLPQTQIVFNGPLIPTAPADLFAGLGKNDQKLYVVPSKQWVVVRLGESAGQSALALSSFDTQLWQKLSELECGLGSDQAAAARFSIRPNPASRGEFAILGMKGGEIVEFYDRIGRYVRFERQGDRFSIQSAHRMVFAKITTPTGSIAVLRIVLSD